MEIQTDAGAGVRASVPPQRAHPPSDLTSLSLHQPNCPLGVVSKRKRTYSIFRQKVQWREFSGGGGAQASHACSPTRH